MRKNIKKFAGIVLCIGMFTGCAQTPDSSLVKPKGSKAVDAYISEHLIRQSSHSSPAPARNGSG